MSDEIRKSGKFSVLMDTTTDVSGYDQCVIVLRYLFETSIKERILSLKCVESSTGENLFNTLKETLNSLGIDIKKCVANSFDGAANMSGQYKGVKARLEEESPNNIHTWCYAHSLNLVMTDAMQCDITTISFFGLLQQTQVFIKDSHKRLAIYLDQNPSVRLGAIGITRWRSRSDAACKIFGRFDNWSECDANPSETLNLKLAYIELILALSIISDSEDFNPKTRSEANSLLQKFVSYETILTAMMCLMIFKITTPLSDYLQTKNLDYAQAWNIIASSQKLLDAARQKFDQIVEAAEKFVEVMTYILNKKIEESVHCFSDIIIENEFPKKRRIIRKKKYDENSQNEVVFDAKQNFKVKTFLNVIDQINSSMRTRFSDQKRLYQDLSCFDPKRFKEIKNGIPNNALEKICQLNASIDKPRLVEELQSFANQWAGMSSTLLKQTYRPDQYSSDDENTRESEDAIQNCVTKIPCKSRVKCAYNLIYQYNMYSVMYTELDKAYKFILTIPLTQVSCERAFSKLKLIKTRLRSTLTNENREALLLMQSEKGIHCCNRK
ncbi:hypothetical protein JTE90_008629 [Oedothorax gibbosus]|uniref:HAT C-terminal dimerisation domain-containing protein n=1 Tax=Oedothorax gibbosus TaxID=931172 RepID=A0AAV6TZL7_9ARAC|nr:hypothetical protein JTE90_008629 [Oedothorax gibbosus]